MSAYVSRRRIFQLAARETGRASRATLKRLIGRFSLKKPTPSRLLLAPQDLQTGDPTIAGDIYSGFFVFSGRAVATSGRSPFDYEPPSAAWGEGLYGFGWLRHLRAANTALSQANARALVDDFLHQINNMPPIAERADVKARRLIAFICHSPVLLEGAEREFYQRFLKAIGRMMRELELASRAPSFPRFRLLAAIACCYAGLCSEGLGAPLQRSLKALNKELDEQILPDGGHISRNPRLLIEILFYLLPLRQIFISRDMEQPPALVGAIDRIFPMIRMLRHGDGNMARFNGMTATDADYLATLLLYDEARARPIQHAPHSGYERLEADQTLILVDVGQTPPLEHSTDATGGLLSFELSHGEQAIVVNCGMPANAKPEVREAARTTAAHSTATIDHTSSISILKPMGAGLTRWISSWLTKKLDSVVLQGSSIVRCERGEWNNGTMLSASHNAFETAFGVVHERRWFITEDGMRLNGEDIFQGTPGRDEVIIRFHLAPMVKAELANQGTTILLTLPDGTLWQFDSCPGARIEDSMFFASALGARKTQQLVISFPLNDAVSARWRFVRLKSSEQVSGTITDILPSDDKEQTNS